MKRITILFLLLVTALLPLSARGRAEGPGSGDADQIYLLFGAGERPDPVFLERFHLPLAVASYAWTGFGVQGGEVVLREAGGMRILSKRLILEEPLGGFMVLGYALKASGYDADPGPPREVLTVRFDYPRQPGDRLLVQPAHQALLEGIRAAGQTSGFIRLQELVYLGSGRFQARVALR